MIASSRKRNPFRFFWWIPGVVILAPMVYMLAAVVLGLIPANRGWDSTHDGVTVWLTTNGVHAGIAMPARNAYADWTQLYPPVH
ncbi:MAG: hypothetical protein ABWX83_10095, partial [Luteibacter sp.]